MATRNISARISLDGADEIKKQLEAVGQSGTRAFQDLKDASERADFAGKFDEAKVAANGLVNGLAEAGQAGQQAGQQITNSFQEVTSQVDKASSSTSSLGSSFTFTAAAIAAAAATIGFAIGNVISQLTTSATETNATLEAAAQKAGLSIQAYELLSNRIETMGGSAKEAISSLDSLGKSAASAVTAAKNAGDGLGGTFGSLRTLTGPIEGTNKALVQLGINLHSFGAQDDQSRFQSIRNGLSSIKDGAEQARLAYQLFGRNAGTVLQTLKGALDGDGSKSFSDIAGAINKTSSQLDELGRSASALAGSTSASKAAMTETSEVVKVLGENGEQTSVKITRFGKALDLGNLSGTNKVLTEMGINLKKFATEDAAARMNDLRDAFAKITDETKKSDRASELFGDRWRIMLKTLGMTKEEAADADAALAATGRQLDDTARKALSAERGAFGEFTDALKATKDQIGAIFAPGDTTRLEFLTSMIDKARNAVMGFARDGVKALDDFFAAADETGQTGLERVVEQIKGTAIDLYKVIVNLVVPAFVLLKNAFSTVASGINSLFGSEITGRFLAIAVAVGALVFSFGGFSTVLGPIATLLGGIIVALGGFVPALTILSLLFFEFWGSIKETALDVFEAIKKAVPGFREALSLAFSGDYAKAWTVFRDAAVGAWGDVKKAILGTQGPVGDFFRTVATVIAVMHASLDALAAGFNTIFGSKLTGNTLGLLIAFGSLTGTLSNFSNILISVLIIVTRLSTPLLLMGAAAVILARQFNDLGKSLELISTGFNQFLSGEFGKGFESLKKAFEGFFTNLTKEGPGAFAILGLAGVAAFRVISGALLGLASPLGLLLGWPALMIAAIGGLALAFSSETSAIGITARGLFDAIKALFTGNWGDIGPSLRRAFDWSGVQSDAQNTFSNILLGFAAFLAGWKVAVAVLTPVWAAAWARMVLVAEGALALVQAMFLPGGALLIAAIAFGALAGAAWAIWKDEAFKKIAEVEQRLKQQQQQQPELKGLDPSSSFGDKFNTSLFATGQAIRTWIWGPIEDIGIKAKAAFDDLAQLGSQAAGIVGTFFKDKWDETLLDLKTKYETLKTFLPQLFSDIWTGIKTEFQAFVDDTLGYFQKKWEALKSLFSTGQPKSAGADTSDTQAQAQAVDELNRKLADTPTLTQSIIQSLRDMGNAFVNGLSGATSGVDQKLNDTKAKIEETGAAIGTMSGNFVIANQSADEWNAKIRAAAQNATTAAQAAQQIQIQPKVGELTSEFNRRLKEAADSAKKLGSEVKGAVTSVGTQNPLQPLTQGTTDAEKKAKDLGLTFDDVYKAIKGAGASLWNELGVSSAAAAENTIKALDTPNSNPFDGILSKAKTAFDGVVSAATTAASSISDQFSHIGGLDALSSMATEISSQMATAFDSVVTYARERFADLAGIAGEAAGAAADMFGERFATTLATRAVVLSLALRTAFEDPLSSLDGLFRATFEAMGLVVLELGRTIANLGEKTIRASIIPLGEGQVFVNLFGVAVGLLTGVVGELTAAFGVLSIALGNVFKGDFIGVFQRFYETIKPMIVDIAKLNEGMVQFASLSTAANDASGPSSQFATIGDMIENIIKSIGGVILSVGNLVAGVGLVTTAIGEWAGVLGIPLQLLGTMVEVLGNLIGLVGVLTGLFGSLFGSGGGGAPSGDGLIPVSTGGGGGGDFFTQLAGSVDVLIGRLFELARILAADMFSGLMNSASAAFQNIISMVENLSFSIQNSLLAIPNGIQGAMDGITSVIQGMIDSINQSLSDLEQRIRDVASAAANAGSGLGNGGGDTTMAFARGGHVFGPGTGTSDSILARLSNGEFVIREAAVRHFGPAFFALLNNLKLPKFATGGLVNMSMPSFAMPSLVPQLSGSVDSGGPLAPVNLHIGSDVIGGLLAPTEVVNKLKSFASQSEVRSAGTKPTWWK